MTWPVPVISRQGPADKPGQHRTSSSSTARSRSRATPRRTNMVLVRNDNFAGPHPGATSTRSPSSSSMTRFRPRTRIPHRRALSCPGEHAQTSMSSRATRRSARSSSNGKQCTTPRRPRHSMKHHRWTTTRCASHFRRRPTATPSTRSCFKRRERPQHHVDAAGVRWRPDVNDRSYERRCWLQPR